MLKLDGIRLRNEIVKDLLLHAKTIPFIFMTANATIEDLKIAYELSVQGFFTKPDSNDDLLEIFRIASNYWTKCLHP